MSHRPLRLVAGFFCSLLAASWGGGSAWAQETAPAQPAKPQQTAPPKPAEPKKVNPFETIPQSTPPATAPETAPAKPAAPPTLERPASATEAAPAKPQPAKPAEAGAPPQDVIEAIEFRGARRVPQDTLRALIFTKKGDKYDPDALYRDFMALWNQGRFDDVSLEREPGQYGWIVRFVVTERRVVRSIKYEGNKSISVSEILDRFKERRVGLSVEQQYEQARVQRAVNVLKEYLSERGRQFATVEPDIKQIPPSSVEVVFKIKEGAKVKVGKIEIENNKAFGDRAVIRAMRNTRPIGIPHSLILENLFAKTFDSTKLEEDRDRIRNFYQIKGYFTARTRDPEVTMRDIIHRGPKIPLLKPNRPGKVADIKVNVEEGRQYRLNKVYFQGVKLFKTPETLLMRPIFGMGEGDIFSTEKLQKGFKELQKFYGSFGYIDAVPDPEFNPLPDSGKLDLTISVDEGKQFFVRRIDFAGNSTTRDKVIRRELLVNEGDMYNTRMWEMSILRLNQLGYFEQLKENEAATVTRDTRNNTVDILLKVKERGRNSISLNGGVSGISGSFVGFGYSTNNFLGLGETLSLQTELGDRIRSATFGFTEPYFLDRPIQTGFTVYTQRFNYDQGREVSIFTGRNLLPIFDALGKDNLLNYTTNSYGFTTFMSTMLKRSFARVSITYGWDHQNITPNSTSATNYFDFVNFQNFDGPNSLKGIISSRITPAYVYNTVNHPITPNAGKSIYVALSYAGGPLGGNVNMLEPTASFTYYRRGLKPGHVIGLRLLGRFVSGYGGKAVPPYNRIIMGGEQDVRGFDIWTVSPYVYIPSQSTIPVYNNDGSARMQKRLVNGVLTDVPVTQSLPVYQLTFPGGDTQGISNFEYRIPIVGPLNLALFFDAGINRVTLRDQLRLNTSRIDNLNAAYPQVGFDNKAFIIEGSQKIRTSTGAELQIMMPVVNAPFRLYWAYNPTRFDGFLSPPVVLDRSMFPNDSTYYNAVLSYGLARRYPERKTMFRFTISRTF